MALWYGRIAAKRLDLWSSLGSEGLLRAGLLLLSLLSFRSGLCLDRCGLDWRLNRCLHAPRRLFSLLPLLSFRSGLRLDWSLNRGGLDWRWNRSPRLFSLRSMLSFRSGLRLDRRLGLNRSGRGGGGRWS